MRLSATFVAIVAAAGISGVHAQDVPRPGSSGQTFKSTTRLIQVSVVVHDGRRRPIADLKAEDFEIIEDGQPQPVSVFSVRGQAPSDAAVEASGVFTNRLQSPTAGGVVAIVFDRLNTSFGEQTRARAHIIKYLGQVRPEDRVALFVLGNDGMRVLHDFSKDAGSLLRAINRAQATTDAPALAGSQALIPERLAFDDELEANLDAFARGNLEVRHRSGYFAVQPVSTDTNMRQKAILDALDSPLEATSLPMTVTIGPAADGRLTLAVQLDRSAPTLVKENGLWVGSVDVAIA